MAYHWLEASAPEDMSDRIYVQVSLGKMNIIVSTSWRKQMYNPFRKNPFI